METLFLSIKKITTIVKKGEIISFKLIEGFGNSCIKSEIKAIIKPKIPIYYFYSNLLPPSQSPPQPQQFNFNKTYPKYFLIFIFKFLKCNKVYPKYNLILKNVNSIVPGVIKHFLLLEQSTNIINVSMIIKYL